MGDRICLTFTDGREISPTLYSHWKGMGLIEEAEAFWERYHDEIRDEPSNMMVNFISYVREGRIEDGGLYLYRTEEQACSPDDNGFWIMNTKTGEIRRYG